MGLGGGAKVVTDPMQALMEKQFLAKPRSPMDWPNVVTSSLSNATYTNAAALGAAR